MSDYEEDEMWWPAEMVYEYADGLHGQEIATWLVTRIQNEFNARGYYEYADHWRVCDISSNDDLQNFKNRRGCCGEAEWQFSHSSGIIFWFGFNYGH